MIHDPITSLGHNRFLVQEPGEPRRLAWAVRDRGGVTWVFFEGRAYRLAETHPAAPSPSAGEDNALDLAAPMPATVTAVHVTVGQRVTRGDVLITLEAMKMELPIVAPHDGVVKAIACAVGDSRPR